MDKALAIQKEVQRILGTDEVYLVGGSVRDLVMGHEPKDYDFCTPMMPDEMIANAKAAGRRVYTIGQQFGTIAFKVPYTEYNEGGEGLIPQWHSATRYEYVEVTTFRSEIYTSKSRKPEVDFVASLAEDLARRDFTMNAMVLKPDGTIYDPYGGKLDIYAKQIKTVGLPKERIMEDPLRILRAARFAARYNFTIDINFIHKGRKLADRIFDVSVERWVQELDKLLTSKYPFQGMEALAQMGMLERILPELPGYSGGPEQKDYMDVNLAWRDLFRTLDPNPKTARYMATGICARLKFSNERTDFILDKPKHKD